VHSQGEWASRLSEAVQVLYPQGGDRGFRPQVADFFTVLEVFAQVHEGRERLPVRASTLLRDLRKEIATGLEEEVSEIRDPTKPIRPWPHRRWTSQVGGAHVIITSNWDTLVEAAAFLQKRRLYMAWPRDRNRRRMTSLGAEAVVVLKLHGSTDWGLRNEAVRRATPQNYSHLNTRIGVQEDRQRGRWPNRSVLRFRSLDVPRLSHEIGFGNPLMATMALGKTNAIEVLESVWADAYWCLSRAVDLNIIGYSFPSDDLEIRTLLRASTRRAGSSALDSGVNITISNPSPEAHDRARSFLGEGLVSDYFGAN